jgi:predicted nucleic acid-binding protein
MSQYLLDTNHLSPLVPIVHPLRTRILASLASGDVFAIATPVLNEFLFGIRTLPCAQQNVRIWEKIQADFVYYAVDGQTLNFQLS